MDSFTHEQKIKICSQTKLDDIFIAHEQTIICRQLFAGHVVGSRPMKRKKNLHRMIAGLITNQDYPYPCMISIMLILPGWWTVLPRKKVDFLLAYK